MVYLNAKIDSSTTLLIISYFWPYKLRLTAKTFLSWWIEQEIYE